jgi:hypothetical protein
MINDEAFAVFFKASPHNGRNTYSMRKAAKRAHRKEGSSVDLAAAYALGLRQLKHAIKFPEQF